ncbi:MAG: PAS domain S-box protein, partial [Candidatus Anammoxibacter sp.]
MTERERKTENEKVDIGNIQRELNKFSNAINQTADSVMNTDKDGIIEYVNPAFEMLTGYTRAAAVGQTPRILKSGKHEPGFYDNLWSTIISGKVFRTEFTNKTKYGVLYYQSETITPVLDEAANVTSFISTSRDITEYKRLEEILRKRESEKRFRIMTDTAPVMIWMTGTDTDKGFNFLNKGWLDYTGRTISQEIGDGWTANIHPEDLKRLLEEYSSAFKAKREFKIEYRHRRFDNKYRWILNTGVPRFTNDGGFAGYIGSCIDINERKQAEETIQSIVEKHPDGILIVDMDGIVRFTNRSAEFIFKRTKEKLKDKMFGLPLTANDMTEIGIIRKTGEPGIGEMRKDITKWKGKPAYLVSIRDITERKKAEEGLRMSEANLAEAQRIGHMGNVEWDIVNDKVYMSEEVYQIYGLKPDDFGNNYQAYKSTVHPDDIEFYEKSTNEALYKNKPYRIEHRIIRPDGAVRIVHKHAVVTFDDAGKPIRMFGTVHDITERKKREDELLKTQKLESIGILAGGIAHDFNNILTAILGFTNLAIINAKEDDKICKNLVKVEKATIRAKDLTQQLLTFSKGGAPIRKAVSIAELIKDAAEFALRGKNIKCKFSIS